MYAVTLCKDLNDIDQTVIDALLDDIDPSVKMLVFSKSGPRVVKWAKHYRGQQYYSGLSNKIEEWAKGQRGFCLV